MCPASHLSWFSKKTHIVDTRAHIQGFPIKLQQLWVSIGDTPHFL